MSRRRQLEHEVSVAQ